MKKAACFLLLSLALFSIHPFATGEEPSAGIIHSPSTLSESNPSPWLNRLSPAEGIDTRFEIQSPFHQSIQQDAPDTNEPPTDREPSAKSFSAAQNAWLLDVEVQTFGSNGNDRLLDVASLRDGGFLLVGDRKSVV